MDKYKKQDNMKLKGIHLISDDVDELHELARKFLISKSWFSSTPYLHYMIVWPSKLFEIEKYLNKKK